jgi:hypothetical protein
VEKGRSLINDEPDIRSMRGLTTKFLSVETVSRCDAPQALSDHMNASGVLNVYRPASRTSQSYQDNLCDTSADLLSWTWGLKGVFWTAIA